MMAYWMGFLGLLVGLAWYYAAQGARDNSLRRSPPPGNNGMIPRPGTALAGSVQASTAHRDGTSPGPDFNPATGLPMLDGLVDVGGNMYGVDDTATALSTMDAAVGVDMMDDSSLLSHAFDSSPGINPASGLPMLDSAIDVGGNPYGSDAVTSTFSSFDDDFSSTSSTSSFSDDSFMSTGSSWDDSNWM